jgi:hypothetical protein
MKITIVVDDKFISINDEGLLNIQQDFSWIPEDVHAFHWNETSGEIEFRDTRLNETVNELGIFEQAIQTFNAEKTRRQNILIQQELSRDYMFELRMYRNARLSETDWTRLDDVNLSNEDKLKWEQYRQELRNLPDNVDDPKPLVLDMNHPSWPEPPVKTVLPEPMEQVFL